MDTHNLLSALDVEPGSTVVLQASPSAAYVIKRELPVPPGVHVTGRGAGGKELTPGLVPTIRQALGANLACLMASSGYLAGKYKTPLFNTGHPKRYADAAIEIDHIVFDGNNGGSGSVVNTVGHGIVLYSVGSKVHDCSFIDVAQAAIVVADRNYAGLYCEDQNFENRVVDNFVMNPGSYGLWATHTAGAIGATDGYMTRNTVVSPSRRESAGGPAIDPHTGAPYEAIRMDNSAGWWITDNLMRACPGNGIHCNTTWGLHLLRNVIDGFGCAASPKTTYTGYDVVTAGAIKTHPGFMCGNIAAAYEGANPYGSVPGHTTNYQYYSISMQHTALDVAAWFVDTDNVAHQASQPPGSIPRVSITSGSALVTVPASAAAGVQPGMAVADSQKLIPAGTTVLSVFVNGSVAQLTLSSAATGSSSTDTLTFGGPRHDGWVYTNTWKGSTVIVHRSNDVATGSIPSVPVVRGSSPFIVIDPADLKAGVVATGSPTAGEVLVASSATAAGWGALVGARAISGPAMFTQSGSFVVPPNATMLRITCLGGGGGGGGGSGVSSTKTQAGGGGGAAGTISQRVVPAGAAGTALSVVVGSGGAGGGGGAGGSGRDGRAGGASTVSGGSLSVVGRGGPGGRGASGSAPVGGAPYGGHTGTSVTTPTSGCGGGSTSAGGAPVGLGPGGGAGGTASAAASGGAGGGGGSATAGGTVSGGAGNAGSSGGAGASASVAGAGGGGGGGAAAGGAGGAGGAGAAGLVLVEVVSWT